MGRRRIYETLFIVSPRIDEEERESIVEKVTAYIEERVGGEIRSVDRWGIKKLAYRVRKGFAEGDYSVILFDADAETVLGLERLYNVTPEIFRWQTFRREDLEKAPPPKKTDKPEEAAVAVPEEAPTESTDQALEEALPDNSVVPNSPPDKPEDKSDEKKA